MGPTALCEAHICYEYPDRPYLLAAAWRRRWTSILLGCLLSVGLPPAAHAAKNADPAWLLRHSEGDLLVHSRPHAGSSIEEFRGVTRVRAKLSAVIALLQDADYNRHWVYRSGGAKVLAREGIARTWVYGVVDAPLPIRDRDTVVRFDLRQDPATRVIIIDILNQPNMRPPVDGLVRVPDFGGFWRLQPQARGWVGVIYQVYGDSGGWVPIWLANYAALRSVVGTLQAMPAAVERYADAGTPGIAD